MAGYTLLWVSAHFFKYNCMCGLMMSRVDCKIKRKHLKGLTCRFFLRFCIKYGVKWFKEMTVKWCPVFLHIHTSSAWWWMLQNKRFPLPSSPTLLRFHQTMVCCCNYGFTLGFRELNDFCGSEINYALLQSRTFSVSELDRKGGRRGNVWTRDLPGLPLCLNAATVFLVCNPSLSKHTAPWSRAKPLIRVWHHTVGRGLETTGYKRQLDDDPFQLERNSDF